MDYMWGSDYRSWLCEDCEWMYIQTEWHHIVTVQYSLPLDAQGVENIIATAILHFA